MAGCLFAARQLFRDGTVLLILVMCLSTPALAASAKPFMVLGGLTSQPIGHYHFCRTHAGECDSQADDGKGVRLTEYGWQIVREVNQAINANIMPITDLDQHGVEERWNYPGLHGDCEDYVLEKRRILIENGVPASDLLITVVRKPNGEGHAILTLSTTEGDFILDNLDDTVRHWTQTPYRFIKRQSSRDAGQWVSIEHADDIMVGALQ